MSTVVIIIIIINVTIIAWVDLNHRRWSHIHIILIQQKKLSKAVIISVAYSQFLARDSIYAIVRYCICHRPSVCLSVTWVDQSKTV